VKKLFTILILLCAGRFTATSASQYDPEGYYAALKVSPTASPAIIKQSYRKLMIANHPDKNRSKEAEERTKSVNHAYDVLKDASKRSAYDNKLPRPIFNGPSKQSQKDKRTSFFTPQFDQADEAPSAQFDPRPVGIVGLLGIAFSKFKKMDKKTLIVGGIVFTATSLYVLAKLAQFSATKKNDTIVSLGMCKLRVTHTGAATLYREGSAKFSYRFHV
jgi:curved DNA-binding protein CbpA